MARVVGVALLAVVAALGVVPRDAGGVQDGPISAPAYLAMFDEAAFRGVRRPPSEVLDLFGGITGDDELDARIRDAAEARGYRRQPVVTAELVWVDGRRLQAPVAEAWLEMKSAARADGVALELRSAYRDLDGQQSLFRRRLGAQTSDAAIDTALRFAAPPGYSRHQTGFVLDVSQAGVEQGGFVNTAAYAWLAADDFAAPRAHGFVPSYPGDGERMGPDPEPWEFAWVGAGRIACATGVTHSSGFCDAGTSDRVDDIVWLVDLGVTVGCRPGRFCPDDPITRGEAASMMWRLHGAPTPTGVSPFADVFTDDVFAPAVAWLWDIGLVHGTSPTTFSPDEILGPDEAFALMVRLTALDDRPPPVGIRGSVPGPPGDPGVVGELGVQVSRAEFASVLRAAVVA
jgi:zinc D-Ala-D-Ala carboxypeptidase